VDFLGLSPSEFLGTTGISMVLIAFFLNLIGIMGRQSPSYLLLNIGGGGLGCYASVLIDFFPFVVLEGVWTVVALGGLVLWARRRAVA
jgi:cytosine/uracil/thiamine/allantoin permease